MESPRQSFTGLTPETLQAIVLQMDQPAYRAGQLFEWIHQKGAADFDEMTNLPAAFRARLAAAYYLDFPAIADRQISADGTRKYLLAYPDGNCVEAVLMRHHHGLSLCISCQVGCRMGCRFCASAQGGLVRNLSAGEMLGEVYAVARDAGAHISHLVMMGIGEPLDNLDEVLPFLALVTHPEGYNLSMRNITLSTCGLVPGIRRLQQQHLGLTLSVSLHAATNPVRSGMMPVNDAYTVEEVMRAARAYATATGRRVSLEYAMVRGVNDGPQDAADLAQLVHGTDMHINLIPINPVDGSQYGPSDEQNIETFRQRLTRLGANATVRRRLGADISAACGQLRRQHALGGKP